MARPTHNEMLSGFPFVEAADPDEAREAVARTYLPHQLEALESNVRLDMRLNAFRVGAITLGYLRYGAAVRLVTAEAGNYHVNVPLVGSCEQRCGSFDPVSAHNHAAVFMPGFPADLRWSADCAQLCVMIDRHQMEFELEQHLGRPLGKPVRFTTAMDVGTPHARSWLAVLDLLERETARAGGMAHHPMGATHLQNLVVTGLLLAQPHNYSSLLHAPARPAPHKAVRQAVELLEGDPGRSWSSAVLAQQVAMSVRSLQEGFQRSFDLAPMAYLREVRLTRVHDELVAASPGAETISSVAARWGFWHAGRFAVAYRRKFGCAPSETLRKGRY